MCRPTQGRPTVRLYHLETMSHLQDVSVSSVIQNLIQGLWFTKPYYRLLIIVYGRNYSDTRNVTYIVLIAHMICCCVVIA